MTSDFDDELGTDLEADLEEHPRRDRREHGGASARPDDEDLQSRLERERVEAGLEDYDPEDVPPATDAPETFDPRATEEYAEEKSEARRQSENFEFGPIDEEHPYPPTRYDRS